MNKQSSLASGITSEVGMQLEQRCAGSICAPHVPAVHLSVSLLPGTRVSVHARVICWQTTCSGSVCCCSVWWWRSHVPCQSRSLAQPCTRGANFGSMHMHMQITCNSTASLNPQLPECTSPHRLRQLPCRTQVAAPPQPGPIQCQFPLITDCMAAQAACHAGSLQATVVTRAGTCLLQHPLSRWQQCPRAIAHGARMHCRLLLGQWLAGEWMRVVSPIHSD